MLVLLTRDINADVLCLMFFLHASQSISLTRGFSSVEWLLFSAMMGSTSNYRNSPSNNINSVLNYLHLKGDALVYVYEYLTNLKSMLTLHLWQLNS